MNECILDKPEAIVTSKQANITIDIWRIVNSSVV